jgi:predicted RNA-binding Zn ribbon-like protein
MATQPSGEPVAGCVSAPRDDLCLGFVNTRYWRGSPAPTDDLRTIGDLLAFAAAGGVDAALIDALAAHWQAHPLASDLALAAAIEVREGLHRIFAAIAEGGAAAGADLAALNAALAAAAERTRMALRDRAYVWEITLPGRNAVGLLSPVLWSAADLLAGPRRGRVRQCANPLCRWVFLDETKGGNRRWCSMAACGNRAKAHRHYLKRKQG